MNRIYVLSDPRSGEVRYVGKTKQSLQLRLTQHLLPSSLRARCYKASWIKSLLNQGLRPVIETLEENLSRDVVDEAERFWICQFRALGFRLTNNTDGGDGASGYCWTEEAKRRQSESLKGRPAPWMKDRVWSEESRLKLSRSKTGKKFSVAHRRAMELARPGRPVVDDLNREFGSIGIAARELGVDRALVRRVVQGKQKSAAGRTFRYKDCS